MSWFSALFCTSWPISMPNFISPTHSKYGRRNALWTLQVHTIFHARFAVGSTVQVLSSTITWYSPDPICNGFAKDIIHLHLIIQSRAWSHLRCGWHVLPPVPIPVIWIILIIGWLHTHLVTPLVHVPTGWIEVVPASTFGPFITWLLHGSKMVRLGTSFISLKVSQTLMMYWIGTSIGMATTMSTLW